MKKNNIFCLHEDNPDVWLPSDCNHIVSSKLRFYENKEISRGHSLKITLQGTEIYYRPKQSFFLKPGEIMLMNQGVDYISLIDSKKTVQGICFYFSEELLNKVNDNIQRNDQSLLNDPHNQIYDFKGFPEIIFPAAQSAQWKPLFLMAHNIATGSGSREIPEEFFYALAEAALCSSKEIKSSLNCLQSKRLSTKRELLRRLLLAKQYIEDQTTASPGIKELSAIAMMSEFHFIRTFRQAFGLSPHQYSLKVKLQKAADLLSAQRHTITEIAGLCGFCDIQTFSGTFRRYYQKSPSEYRKSVG